MKKINKQLTAALLLLFVFGPESELWAQRHIEYRDLVMRNQQQPVSFDFITLPANKDASVNFTSIFSLPYSYLPFKRVNQRSSENEFYSIVNLSLEVFKSENNNRNRSVEGLEPAGRAFWSDTAFAKTYEESQSEKEFLKGYLQVSLQPGNYKYVLQIKRGDQTDSQTSRTQQVHIAPYDEMETGNVILGEKLMTEQEVPRMQLSNMGTNVKYAEDFYALAYIPNYKEGAAYSLEVNSLNISDGDTSKQNQTYAMHIGEKDIRTGLLPRIASENGKTYVNLISSDDGFAYALVKIPNSNFPNSFYSLTITEENQQRPVAQGTFRSLWIDMPASLLSLDVAIDMLRFIVDKDKIREMSTGTKAEREQKFRAFWEKRDPTPETQYNELMTEYYRRIDYAYKNFTTDKTIGYESDQGEIYIKFGPPKNVERKFPTNGPTTEIWTYPNRQFVFRATTGFGDFQLISDQSQ